MLQLRQHQKNSELYVNYTTFLHYTSYKFSLGVIKGYWITSKHPLKNPLPMGILKNLSILTPQ